MVTVIQDPIKYVNLSNNWIVPLRILPSPGILREPRDRVKEKKGER